MTSRAAVSRIEKTQRKAPNALKRLLRPLVKALVLRVHEMTEHMVRDDLPPFANEPKNLRIELPRRLSNTQRMRVGDDVAIGPGSFLAAQTHYPTSVMQRHGRPVRVQQFDPTIIIGNRVTATGGLTIGAMQKVVIEDDVMLAANILITDGLHGFQSANEPYKYQPMWRIAPVTVKRGCWIAQNVVIMPGVTVGEFSIVGANSVVTRSLPPRCIAFGNPARVVKRWNEADGAWIPAEADSVSPAHAGPEQQRSR